MSIVEFMKDSNGVRIYPGDIVECPHVPFPEHACRWNAAYVDSSGDFDIRDIGHNNISALGDFGKFYNRGSYILHLDKLSDGDLRYYFNANRKDCELINKLRLYMEEAFYAGRERNDALACEYDSPDFIFGNFYSWLKEHLPCEYQSLLNFQGCK